MGCFAQTCAVSNLPIEYGDSIRYILISSSPYSKQDSSGSNWFVRSFPLRAKYNDYGSVEELEEGIGRDLWEKAFQIDLIGNESIDWDNFLDKISRNKVHVQRNLENLSEEGDPLEINHMMIREDVWQGLLKMPNYDPYDSRIKLTIDQYRDAVRKNYNQNVSFDNLSLEQNIKNRLYWDEILFTVGLGTNWKLLLKLQLSKDQVLNILNDIAEYFYIRQILGLVRWECKPVAIGPQVGEWAVHVNFCRTICQIAENVAERMSNV